MNALILVLPVLVILLCASAIIRLGVFAFDVVDSIRELPADIHWAKILARVTLIGIIFLVALGLVGIASISFTYAYGIWWQL